MYTLHVFLKNDFIELVLELYTITLSIQNHLYEWMFWGSSDRILCLASNYHNNNCNKHENKSSSSTYTTLTQILNLCQFWFGRAFSLNSTNHHYLVSRLVFPLSTPMDPPCPGLATGYCKNCSSCRFCYCNYRCRLYVWSYKIATSFLHFTDPRSPIYIYTIYIYTRSFLYTYIKNSLHFLYIHQLDSILFKCMHVHFTLSLVKTWPLWIAYLHFIYILIYILFTS